MRRRTAVRLIQDSECVSEEHVLTRPYAVLLSCSCVMSATYAKITENVTANTPDIEITAKYHLQRQNTQCHTHSYRKVETVRKVQMCL